MAGEAFERLYISICGKSFSNDDINRPCSRLTSENMPLEMFVPSKGLSTVCAEHHFVEQRKWGKSKLKLCFDGRRWGGELNKMSRGLVLFSVH